jgi:hypothetical protein
MILRFKSIEENALVESHETGFSGSSYLYSRITNIIPCLTVIKASCRGRKSP